MVSKQDGAVKLEVRDEVELEATSGSGGEVELTFEVGTIPAFVM